MVHVWVCTVLVVVSLSLASGEDVNVGVSMCCPTGRVLKMVKNNGKKLGGWRKERGDEYIPKCVRRRKAPKDTLDGSTITVLNEEDAAEVEMTVKKSGVLLPACSLGRKFQMVSLKGSDTNAEGSGDYEEMDTSSRVTLGDYKCGSSKCHKGNVYVDNKPVCDDGWDDTDANVVCRELGFSSGGYSTKESYFGKVDLERQSGFDEVRCYGSETSLVDCRHEAFDDCGDSEGAGVVCYRDSGDYEDEESYPEYGSGPKSSASALAHLSSTGQLLMADNTTYKAGEFCMAGMFEGDPGPGYDKEVKEGEAVALMCEPCKSEVLCSVLLLDFFGSFPGNEIEGDEGSFGTNNVVQVGDKNADGKVDFNEFKAGVDDYAEKLFNIFDKDGDGSLDDQLSIKSLSAKLFLQLVDEGFLFFDVNQDDIMSVEDAPPGAFYDRNDDGKISLREVFRMSMINLPAPLYRLYAALDKDKNEKISIEEATNFVKSALSVIDQNGDCSINIDEFITSLDQSHLPKNYQLAVKLIGDYYFELGDYILKEFVAAADADGNKKTTLAELLGLKDPAILFNIFDIVQDLGLPNMSNIYFIMGKPDRPIPNWRDKEQAVLEMWLNVLYDFVDNQKFQSAPTDYCGF